MQAAHPAREVISMQAVIGENDVTIVVAITVSRPGVGRQREHSVLRSDWFSVILYL